MFKDPVFLGGLGALATGLFLFLSRFLLKRATLKHRENKAYEKLGRTVSEQAKLIQKQKQERLDKLAARELEKEKQLVAEGEERKEGVEGMTPEAVLGMIRRKNKDA